VTKNVLILGAGTACALVANTRVRKLDLLQWEVAVVDRTREHDEAHLLHHASGDNRSLAGAAGDEARPPPIARERGVVSS
jgi:NADH dehydrogenase FAD-containing subunit